MVGLGAGLGALTLLGCSSEGIAGTTSTDPSNTTSNGSCSKVPEETAGPYPADSSNGPNVLNQTGVVRNDIRTSFAGLSGTADGIPLTIALTIVSETTCAPLSNYAVYLWHCDRAGNYSLSPRRSRRRSWRCRRRRAISCTRRRAMSRACEISHKVTLASDLGGGRRR